LTSAIAMEMTIGSVIEKNPVLVAVWFAGLACGTVIVGLALRQYQRRARSLFWSLLIVVLATLAIAVAAALIAARLMVLSEQELVAFLGIAGVASGFAVLLVIVVAKPLGRDVRHLETTVRMIESGDRSVRVDSQRGDELGHVGRAIDDLVSQLATLEEERSAVEEERRTLLSNIGHDLRSPLAALQAATEALVDGVAVDPPRYLRSMQRDIEALRALIDDLSLLSRLDAKRFDIERLPINLVELADEILESLAPIAAVAGVDLVLVATDAVHVVGSPVALARVIRNLVDNGIRHAPEGSEVRVQVTVEGGAVVRVSDRGPGFPDDFRDQAFERFSRADASRSRQAGGVGGLGLAIARGLVEAHGGEIWIEDSANATVAFRVPIPA